MSAFAVPTVALMDELLMMGVDTQQQQREERALKLLISLSYRTGELNTYLNAIAQGVSELLKLDWSVVTLCWDNSERILASTIDLGAAQEQIHELHGTLTGAVVQTGQPLQVEDTHACSTYGQAPPGFTAYMGVPLQAPSGKTIGTICSFQREARVFTEAEVKLAQLFAERAAIALDNFELYQQVQQSNEQLRQEIQERKQTEAALRASEERFRKIFTSSNDAILVIEPQSGQILEANPQACEMLGYSRDALLKDITLAQLHVGQEDAAFAFIQQVLKTGQGRAENLTCITNTGEHLDVDISAAPIDFSGQPCLIGHVRDVTERNQSQRAAIAALERLAEIGELAAMIVHEVRNPLTTVWLGLTSLQRMALPERAISRVSLAVAEAQRLQRLLNEILLYAKPQQLQTEPIELVPLVRDLATNLQQLPVAQTRHLVCELPRESVYVEGDSDKLKQVFINLVTNAFEAIPSGETVTWRILATADGRQLGIEVHNGGDPITPDLLAKLTQPFCTTKASGNGLGLAITKRIVEAHHGNLAIASTATSGTTFTVHLPRLVR
ncbi:MAG: ATP-binding protein [Cyanobacteria bacterium P01_H01_bin.121]